MKLTLNEIKNHQLNSDGWEKLLKSLGKTKADNEPLSLLTVLEVNGLFDALECLQALPEEYESKVRLLVCDFAEPVLHIANDERSTNAVKVARLFAEGKATSEELRAARNEAWEASEVGASGEARDAARAVTWEGSRVAAWTVSGCASRALSWWTSWNKESAAAVDGAWDLQKEIFIKWVKENDL